MVRRMERHYARAERERYRLRQRVDCGTIARDECKHSTLRCDRGQRRGGGTVVDRPFVGWPGSGSCRGTLVIRRRRRMTILRRFEEIEVFGE